MTKPLATTVYDLHFPRTEIVERTEEQPQAIEIHLTDVRAADPIRVTYDYDRDGWVIEQATRFEWEPDDTECDPGWREAAFCAAWQFKEREK